MSMSFKLVKVACCCVFVLPAMANQRIGFARGMGGETNVTFSCGLYSINKTGSGKMVWFPAPACLVDDCHTTRTCKIWAIMPLQGIEQMPQPGVVRRDPSPASLPAGAWPTAQMLAQEQYDFSPVWHFSQKPHSHAFEPSVRYRIQYLGANAETNRLFDAGVENVFDIDAGDVFQIFGRSPHEVVPSLLEHSTSRVEKVDWVLCSSGRIGVDDGKFVLLYSLMINQDGECLFHTSVNGTMDTRTIRFKVKDGGILNSSGKPLGESSLSSYPSRNHWRTPKGREINTSSPAGFAFWLSDPDTFSIRVSSDYSRLYKPEAMEEDIHISVGSLTGILDWLAKPQNERGSWCSNAECSLEKRQIF